MNKFINVLICCRKQLKMAKDDEKKEPSRIDIEYTSKFVSATDSDQALRKGPQEEEFVPPDGGWGWVVCITSLLTNGTAFSILNTFGIIYVYLIKEYASGDPEISFKTCKYHYTFKIHYFFIFYIIIKFALGC